MALMVLAIPPIVTNTYTGMRGVDPEMVEAGRGMGMRESQIVLLVEVPVALPMIMAGTRVAAVQVVATATLGAIVAAAAWAATSLRESRADDGRYRGRRPGGPSRHRDRSCSGCSSGGQCRPGSADAGTSGPTMIPGSPSAAS